MGLNEGPQRVKLKKKLTFNFYLKSPMIIKMRENKTLHL